MAEVQASRFGPISLWSAVVSFGQLWSALQVGFSAADTRITHILLSLSDNGGGRYPV